ncbi:MAG: DUF1501 domain-containing protein [Phycisphaeraceae bacterium]
MLNFNDPVSRRSFLSVGSLALGGLSLSQLMASKALAGAAGGDGKVVKDVSVVFLFMHGGPPQQETFDPKMSAPSGVRSTTDEIKTKIPGITFGGTMHKLAALNDKFSIVRSFSTGDGNHDIKPIVAKTQLNANLGSIYSRVAGTNHPITGMPRNIALFPRAVDKEAGEAVKQFGNFLSTGDLGSAYAPFEPGGDGTFQRNLQLALSRERFDDRRGLLEKIDVMRRTLDVTGEFTGIDRFQTQAFDTILGGVADAFDLSKEDPKLVARYDTSKLVARSAIDKKWNNHPRYADHVASLGKLMLMARRLCERGAGFVTVTTNFVWDFHADQNNAGCAEGMIYAGAPFDHAVSAFIEDVESRGLSKKILLVCCGEMGRTPKVNAKGGRDHWGGLAPLLLHGGGLKMGQTIGESSRDAGEAHTEPIRIPNLISTLMHSVFDVGLLRLDTSVPSEVAKLITGSEPIKELMA